MSDARDQTLPPATREISRIADDLFRNESGKLVSVLTRMFGIERMQLAEDVVQEALIRAMQTWPYYGIPQNPAAWITQTAKHLALDVIRREKSFQDKQLAIIFSVEQWSIDTNGADSVVFETEINDGRLRMLFACCHPSIPHDARVALALKLLCGFSTGEIASAFLTSEAAIAKRITRAKQRMRESNVSFEIPVGDELIERLGAVEQTLYLLFNEGYKASSGESIIREDLCDESIALTALLAEHPVGNTPRMHALLALMLLNAARIPARVDPSGHILRLSEQDRSRWDNAKIARGMHHFDQSARGSELSEYHLQAGIAAYHCAAPDFDSTDWPKILALYDQLLAADPSPVVALNRAVAVAHVHGPQAGIMAVYAIPDRHLLESYYLHYAVLGEFEAEAGRMDAASAHFKRALELTEMHSERELLEKRLRECNAK